MSRDRNSKSRSLKLQELKGVILRRVIDLSTPQLIESSKGGYHQTDWGWVGIKAVVRHGDDPRLLSAAASDLVSDGVLRSRNRLKSVQLITR